MWLSGEPIPDSYARNISRAAQQHPRYTLKRWGLDDANAIRSQFLTEAILEKKWAFATDIIRLFALSTYGGIYFDVDVNFNGSIDDLVQNDTAFISWETDFHLGPHVIASGPGNKFLTETLEAFRNRRFLYDHHIDATPLPTLLTWEAQKHGLVLDGREQKLPSINLHVLPVDIMTLDVGNGRNRAVHDYAGGWTGAASSYAEQVALQYSNSQRPSRRFLRSLTRFMPGSMRQRTYDLMHTRLAYPGAFEAVGFFDRDVRAKWKFIERARRLFRGTSLARMSPPDHQQSNYHRLNRVRAGLSANITSLSMSPSVSIVVPIYNVEPYLSKCLSSLSSQTYKNLRVLLIDDGSTDGSSGIAESFSLADHRFEYYRKQNGGLGSARNFGIERCESDLICFVDSDDWVDYNFVSEMVDTIGVDGDIGFCNYDLVHPDGRLITRYEVAGNWGDDPIAQVLSSGLECSAWNKIYRSSTFLDNGLRFGAGWFEDFAVVPAIIGASVRPRFNSTSLYKYVRRPGSILSLARSNFNKSLDVFGSFDSLSRIRDMFLRDRWRYYYDWTVARHLFTSRAYEIHQEPIKEAQAEKVRLLSRRLAEAMPDWHKTSHIANWLVEPKGFLERQARGILLSAYVTGRPEFYTELAALRRFGF